MPKKRRKKKNNLRKIILVFAVIIVVLIAFFIFRRINSSVMTSPEIGLSPGEMFFSFFLALMTLIFIGIIVYYVLVNRRNVEII